MVYKIGEIFDDLVDNAPSFLKGVELTYDDAHYMIGLMMKGFSQKEARDIVYNEIANVLGI